MNIIDKLLKVLGKFKMKSRKLLFLGFYMKDTPEDAQKFYKKMKYFYYDEFKKREKYSKTLDTSKFSDKLNQNGFVIVKLSDISKKENFFNSINKFRVKFDKINQQNLQNVKTKKKNYLIRYEFEYSEDIKNIADPFIDIVTKYLGTLPILNSFGMWYSPNTSDDLTGSKLLHRDNEDFRQVKVFIPIEEVHLNNGPLNIIDKKDSNKLYYSLINKKKIYRRNQKIDDCIYENLNFNNHKILMNLENCSLVDTCACYHFGSRKSSKPRKLLVMQFTTAFSAKTPIFRGYDVEKKFNLERDKLVYGLQKKLSIHNKDTIFLKI